MSIFICLVYFILILFIIISIYFLTNCMNIFQVILLGFIRGLLEFLPISSTGHIIIVQKILNFTQTNEFLTVILKLGAILASIYFFRNKIVILFKNSIRSIRKGNLMNDRGFLILIATIPSLLIALIATLKLDVLQNSTLIIAFASIFFGIVFYLIERIYLNKRFKKTLEEVTLGNLLIMGTVQGIAVIPGVSRSGSTISAGLTQDLSMKDSIETSFIMGIPVLLIATIYEIIKNRNTFSTDLIFYTIIGFAVAFFTGLVSIRLTLGLLEKKGFLPFMIYRIFFGVLLIALVINGTLIK